MRIAPNAGPRILGEINENQKSSRPKTPNLRDIDGTGNEAIAIAKTRPKMPIGNSHSVKCVSLVVCDIYCVLCGEWRVMHDKSRAKRSKRRFSRPCSL